MNKSLRMKSSPILLACKILNFVLIVGIVGGFLLASKDFRSVEDLTEEEIAAYTSKESFQTAVELLADLIDTRKTGFDVDKIICITNTTMYVNPFGPTGHPGHQKTVKKYIYIEMQSDTEDFLFDVTTDDYTSLPTNTYNELKSSASRYNEETVVGIELELLKVKSVENTPEQILARKIEKLKERATYHVARKFVFDELISDPQNFPSRAKKISCQTVSTGLVRIKFETNDSAQALYYESRGGVILEVQGNTDVFWTSLIESDVYDTEDIQLILKDLEA